MSEKEFEQKMAEAKALLSHRPDYAEGYITGLRRLYHGPRTGSPQEHEKWLSLAYDRYAARSERGRGYLDGFQGIKPRI